MGKLSIDQRRGILSLNPKKDKDIRYLKNWRPITLLNTDYKILAKIFGTRLRTVLPDLIQADQVAYLEGRYIGQNIRIIDGVLYYAKDDNVNGIISCIDFEKAFDSVEWYFINQVLASFNFGTAFMRWSELMYNDISSCVTNNGHSSQFFRVTRGIRQGCPLSAYLFLLVAETLAAGIRQNTHITGIQMGSNEVSVIQMADDTTLFMNNPVSLQRCLLLFSRFGRISGLRINVTKSEAMGLGIFKNLSITKPYGLQWKDSSMKSIGITFHRDPDQTIELNFQNKLTSVRNLLNIWSQRNLSIKGKITVIKSIILPQVLYICSNLAVPEWFVSKVDSCMYHFIWSAKMDKVKRATLINRIDKGGLKMISLETMIQSQRVIWVKRFITQSSKASWTFYFTHLCQKKLLISPEDLFRCNLHPEYLCSTWPLFYSQMLFSWFKLKIIDYKLSPWSVRRETLIYNKDIIIGNQYAAGIFIRWFHAGLRQLHNLFDDRGHLRSIAFLEQNFSLKIDILSYNSIVSAIPHEWKQTIKNICIPITAINYIETPHITVNKKETPISLINNRCVYWKMVKNIGQPPISQIAWNSLFGNTIPWSNIYKIPYEVTYDTKLHSFQYKILLRIFPCNWYVSKFDPDVEEDCTFCDDSVDDICHYFFDCPECRQFWKILEYWIGRKLSIDDTTSIINRKNVVLGYHPHPSPVPDHTIVINMIILHAKWYIYTKKINKSTTLQAPVFLRSLQSIFETHLTIARHQSSSESIQKLSAIRHLFDHQPL